MIQVAISSFCVPSAFIIADKTIQCIFVLVVFTGIANSQVVERVTVSKKASRRGLFAQQNNMAISNLIGSDLKSSFLPVLTVREKKTTHTGHCVRSPECMA